MTKPRPAASNATKPLHRGPRIGELDGFMPAADAPLEIERKLALHQAAQTLRVAADVLTSVECGDALLNFRVRGFAVAVRAVAGELDSVLLADDRAVAARRAEAGG